MSQTQKKTFISVADKREEKLYSQHINLRIETKKGKMYKFEKLYWQKKGGSSEPPEPIPPPPGYGPVCGYITKF